MTQTMTPLPLLPLAAREVLKRLLDLHDGSVAEFTAGQVNEPKPDLDRLHLAGYLGRRLYQFNDGSIQTIYKLRVTRAKTESETARGAA